MSWPNDKERRRQTVAGCLIIVLWGSVFIAAGFYPDWMKENVSLMTLWLVFGLPFTAICVWIPMFILETFVLNEKV